MTLALGLDISSTATGAVMLCPGPQIVIERVIQAPKKKWYGRYSAMADQLSSLVIETRPDVVVIEDYGYANAHTLVPLVEVGTVLRWFLLQHGLSFHLVAPATLKKFVTGTGNAKKEQMMMQVFKRWGYEAPSNDLADAFGLACMGLAALDHLTDLTKAQDEAMAKMRHVSVEAA